MKRKLPTQAGSMPLGILVGLVVSILVTIFCCATTALMLSNQWIEEGSVGTAALVTLLLSSGVGALVVGVWVKGKYLPACLGSGLAYYVCLLCITGLFFDGAYRGLLPSALAILGGCGSVALLMAQGSGGTGRSKRRYKVR